MIFVFMCPNGSQLSLCLLCSGKSLRSISLNGALHLLRQAIKSFCGHMLYNMGCM